MSLERCGIPCLIAVIFLHVCGGAARAQAPARLRKPIEDTQLTRIEHSAHPLAKFASEAGRVESDKKLERMFLVLSPSDAQRQELKQLLEDLHNPSSPNYHHWLTPAQFGARFGTADSDVQAVGEWLRRNGFQVAKTEQSKKWLEFSGTAAQVEAAFHTRMRYYLMKGNKYFANSEDIALPSALAELSPGVSSLSSFGKISPRLVVGGFAGRDAQGKKIKLSPSLTATDGTNFTYYVAPGDFAKIYNTSSLLSAGIDGTGVSIAVLAQSNVELTDIQMFRQVFGLKANDPNIVLSGPDPGITNPIDAQEATLDTEWAGAVAPGATINLVIAGSTATTNGVDLAAEYAIENEIAPILTYTYGTCEQALGPAGNAFYNALWQQAAAQGMTVLVATGDNGAAGCDDPNAGLPATQGFAVSGTASTPYNVAVGGTQFNEGTAAATYWNASNGGNFSSAVGYIPEAGWNESCDPDLPTSGTNCYTGSTNFSLLASGGGASTVYAKPSWQTGNGVPADGHRDVPDVSLAAGINHDDIVYCSSLGGAACQVNGQQGVVGLTLVGGTSAATPAMAGILALVEQKNGSYQGQINNILYRLAETNSCDASKQTNPAAQNSCVFYDITSGGNAVPCAGGSAGCSSTQAGTNGFLTGQSAAPGYDLATGLGSVNAANLANDWKNTTLAASLTKLQVSNAAFVHGTAVSVSGSVAALAGTGTPSGIVGLKTDAYGNVSDVLTLANGALSGSFSDLPGGQYNLSAHYAGDATFAPSDSSSVAVNVTPEASSTAISVNGLQNGASMYGSSLSIVVKVKGASGMGASTGNVTLQDNGTSVGVFPLTSDGEATIPAGSTSPVPLAPGNHSLTASFAGDNSFNASASTAVAFSVGLGTPFVVVGANSTNISAGQTAAVHVVVSGFGDTAPTGAVQITDNGVAVGAAIALQNGGFFGNGAQASSLLTNLAAGQHTIGATYLPNGDPNYIGVASGDPKNEISPLPIVTVAGPAGVKTTTTLAATTSPVNLGDTATFSVSVAPNTATGTVTLWDAVGPRSAATAVSGGAASISIAWPQGGTDAVYAVYSGDAADAPSTSPPVSFTVSRGVPVVTLSAPATAGEAQQVSVNVMVTGNPANPVLAYPTGIIQIFDSVNGTPLQIITAQTLTAGAGNIAVFAKRFQFSGGTHTLHAHYVGDNNWQPADSPNTSLIAADFTVGLSPSPLSFVGGSAGTATVTVTPLNGFTGAVNLSCPTGGTAPPAGYTCAIAASVTLGNGAATTPLNLNPASTSATGAIQMASARSGGAQSRLWVLGALAGIAMLGLAVGRLSGNTNAHNFASLAGFVVCVLSLVWGCGGGSGGGGGGGGGPVASITTLTSSNLKIGYGTPVQFNITVSASVTPMGRVQLVDNGQPLGSAAPVNSGIATFSTSSLPVGMHVLTAEYQGDASTKASNSTPITEVVVGSVPLQITAASGSGISHTANVTVMVN